MKKMEGWRAALRQVADLAGSVLSNQADGHESKFIQKIVQEIAKKLDRRVLSVTSHAIGVESHVEDINLWLQDGSTNVGIMVICGMGGIGKTTIAKTVYNQNFYRFEGSSFLTDIRETSKQFNGLVSLQEKLFSDIFKGTEEKIRSVDEGIIKIKDAICCRRVLLVLDDVDELGQVNAIFGMRDWFHPGSKIIITSRHERLLKAHEVCEIYKVKELDYDEALRLFSWHAFRQDYPIEAYMELSERIIHHCQGLPLALEVLGSSLFGESVDAWESALAKFRSFFDKKIQNVLLISYDSLDNHDKNLFLDIACFFVGRDKDFAVKILEECDFRTAVGIQNLVHRCLVTVSVHNKLMMHQLLIDMGREIIHQESLKEPGKRSRVWRHEDAYSVLREKTGTETIEGLILDLHELKVDNPPKKVSIAQYHFEDFVDKSALICNRKLTKRRRLDLFSWLPIFSALTESDEVDLKTNAFSGMHKLRILQLNNVHLTGCYEEFPKKLRWLCWHGFPLNVIPYNFPLENLVVLDMRNSSLGQFWKGTKTLKSLKILNLSHSHALANSPDFSRLPNLENLILVDCINLVALHESIGKLGKLVLLNLRGCKRLGKLPREIVQLKSLEELILSYCSRLHKLPSDLGKMESLKVLQADGINQLSSTTGEIKPWHKVIWSCISKPRSSPESTGFLFTSLPRWLLYLNLANCNISSDRIPADLCTLSSLEALDLSENPICSLPRNLKGLTRLQKLELNRCTMLQSLLELPKSLKHLSLNLCSSLEMVTNLPNLFQRLRLNMVGCSKLVEVQGLLKLEPMGNIDSEMIKHFRLTELDSSRMLEVEFTNRLTRERKKVSGPQGLYECGIYSIFLPGREIPDWFSLRSRRGLSIPLTIPSFPNLKIRGLHVCVVYSHSWSNPYYLCITVRNKTRDLTWIYYPTIQGIPEKDKYLIWFSNWKIANLLMEGGDDVCVSVITWQLVKEIGIQILYANEEEQKGTQNNTSCPNYHQNVIDLSVYQRGEREYLLCNNHHVERKDAYGSYSMISRARRKAEELKFSSNSDIENGNIKLNTGGSSRGDLGPTGFGGWFRDNRGIWVNGYYGKSSYNTSLEAKLWSIYRGLTIILEKGWKKVEIETDSELAVKLIRNGVAPSFPHRALIVDSCFLLQRCLCTIKLTPREGNQCANLLANMGADQTEPLVVLDEPPDQVQSLQVADKFGIKSKALR